MVHSDELLLVSQSVTLVLVNDTAICDSIIGVVLSIKTLLFKYGEIHDMVGGYDMYMYSNYSNTFTSMNVLCT